MWFRGVLLPLSRCHWINANPSLANSLDSDEMAKIYKVVGIEGKGLGCVASKGQKISGGNCDVFDSPKKPDRHFIMLIVG